MAYGLKYQSQFDSVSDANNISHRYTLQFLFKDYTGGATSIDGGGTSVVQNCTDDNPLAPIKGQSLDIRLINDGNVPITAFQSEDDDGVQVKLLDENSNILFIGFLVQDDFYELMVDYSHEITLSANDSLGLLKGVILSEASVRRKYPMAEFETNGVDTVVYVYVADSAFYPQAGNTIEFLGVPYTIATAVKEDTVISSIGYNWTITLTTTTGGIEATEADIYLTGEINLLNRNSLLSVIAVCLAQTNLSLITNIFMNLYEYRQDNTVCSFDQTLIDTQLFISGETYEDCYSVLSKVMTAFNCSIFQANGQWNIVHWQEAVPKESWSYPNNAIPGFVYDETWTAAGTTVFDNNFNIGPDPQLTQPLFGLTQGALRGYKFSRKVFDYQNPKYLLKNLDLKILGNLIRTYINGTERWSEYELPNWQDSDINAVQCTRFIRVILDSFGNEIKRYIVITGGSDPATISTFMLKSNDIELQEGDIVDCSFSYSTAVSIPTNAGIVFGLSQYDGTNNYWARNFSVTLPDPPEILPKGVWDIQNTWPSASLNRLWRTLISTNTNEWQTCTFQTGRAEVNGLLNVWLANVDSQTPFGETRYKDFTFSIINTINDSTKIIGQIHKQDRDVNKKLNSDTDIQIDDSPRNSIVGTLFNPTITGLLQDRTTTWRYPLDANGWKLGELTTLEELTWRQKTRSKLEGGFTGNYQNYIISLLTMVITDFNTSKNYNFGLLSIDYKNNAFSGTLWELYDNEDAYFDPNYTLTYKYETE